MNNIINKTNEFIEKDIFKDNILKTIIDKMIGNNNFDFFSNCAIYLKKPSVDILFPEHYINTLNYHINSTAKPILMPLPTISRYFLKDGKYVSMKNATLSDKEKILNKELEIKDEYAYNLYVFYNIKDTNCECIDSFFNTYTRLNLDITLETITLLCNQTGISIEIKDMEYLDLKSLFDRNKKIIFVDEKLNIMDKSFEIMKAYLSLLFHKTSTQTKDISEFELDICLYILATHLYINYPFPALIKCNDISSSVNRCFKIIQFIIDKLNELERVVLEHKENENIPDEDATSTSVFKNIKGGNL